ncbi:hypothetical protein UG55_102958 [Frankia sp. EI5c]|uniref:hypothetical protein n=1 Tax=Frankia sp. EI5c TaxID=683316 RepID=UPI0007C25689|nr:hypothetical protein [Frankia sp. EI5c]OAA24536.1 hypothetical protein UG55_102958 [Frankia sp. EI5c]
MSAGQSLERRGQDRGNSGIRLAILLVAALGAGFAGGRLTRMPARVAAAPGDATDGSSTRGRDAGFPRAHPEGGSAVMAGIDPTDPASPLRFGERGGPLATEDAANPPYEAISTNTDFANDMKGDAPTRADSSEGVIRTAPVARR